MPGAFYRPTVKCENRRLELLYILIKSFLYYAHQARCLKGSHGTEGFNLLLFSLWFHSSFFPFLPFSFYRVFLHFLYSGKSFSFLSHPIMSPWFYFLLTTSVLFFLYFFILFIFFLFFFLNQSFIGTNEAKCVRRDSSPFKVMRHPKCRPPGNLIVLPSTGSLFVFDSNISVNDNR